MALSHIAKDETIEDLVYGCIHFGTVMFHGWDYKSKGPVSTK